MRAMGAEHSDKVADLQRRLTAFMDEHVYPNETTYHRQIDDGDRWDPTAIIEELKMAYEKRKEAEALKK